MFVGRALTLWKAKKQSFVAKSTFEAECGALSALVSELMWCKETRDDIMRGDKKTDVPLVLVDNQGTVSAANQNKLTHRNKTVAIEHHHVHDQVEKKKIKVRHVRTDKNLADVLTKALGVLKCKAFVKWLMGHSPDEWEEVAGLT